MSRRDLSLAAHTAAIAVLAGITAGLGVFGRGGGRIASATSIRGEQFEYVTDGIYAYNPVRVVAEGIGWDVVTAFGVAPALLLVSWFVARGSLRGRLAATGLLGYVCYQYLMYAMFWAIGPLFPAFVLLYPLALWGIVRLIAATDLDDLAARLGPGFPRRATALVLAGHGAAAGRDVGSPDRHRAGRRPGRRRPAGHADPGCPGARSGHRGAAGAGRGMDAVGAGTGPHRCWPGCSWSRQ